MGTLVLANVANTGANTPTSVIPMPQWASQLGFAASSICVNGSFYPGDGKNSARNPRSFSELTLSYYGVNEVLQ